MGTYIFFNFSQKTISVFPTPAISDVEDRGGSECKFIREGERSKILQSR